MRTSRAVAFLAALLLPAAAIASHEFPTPAGVAEAATAAGTVTVWPYTTGDFTDPAAPAPSDPVNLIVLNTDPRAVRQALISLDGVRAAFPAAAPFNCRWFDGMGNEHAAYGEPEGWVGGAIQLTCHLPGGNPLGNPFRYHVRLFRAGEHTLVGAHFEVNIKGTAEHDVLSWNRAREFVLYDLVRAGAVLSSIPAAPLFTPAGGSFRTVLRPVFDGILAAPGGALILGYAGLLPAPATGNVPVPADGVAYVVAPGLAYDPAGTDVTTRTTAPYDVNAPKVFCNFQGSEFVHLGGSLELELRVQTTPSGKYLRTYSLGGTLTAQMLSGPDAGKTFDVLVQERHRAMLTDEYQEVTEAGAQTLLRVPAQLKAWALAAGHQDRYVQQTVCGS